MLALAGAGVSCTFSAPAHRGPKSHNFDGERFFNLVRQKPKSFFNVIKMASERTAEWHYIDASPGPPPPPNVGPNEMRVTFINHATTLLQLDGVNVLTDPIYDERASPVSWAGPERYRPPGIRFEDLPPIHAVVISHNHYDHLNLPTLRRLADEHHPQFFVGLGNELLLGEAGIEGAVPLDWWESRPVHVADKTVEIHAVPAQHWSGRSLTDRYGTLWAGWVIAGLDGYAYFAGDTGWGPHFELIYERFGAARLAILPIGAFQPRWMMQDNHISPGEAADAAKLLHAQVSVPVHYGTFYLGAEEQDEPPRALGAYLATMVAPVPEFWVLDFGEGRDVPRSAP